MQDDLSAEKAHRNSLPSSKNQREILKTLHCGKTSPSKGLARFVGLFNILQHQTANTLAHASVAQLVRAADS